MTSLLAGRSITVIGAGTQVAAADGRAQLPTLIAASNSPPSVRDRIRTEEITSIDSAVATFTAMGGQIPAEVLRDPELAARAYPVLRGDLYLSQSLIESTRHATTAGDIRVLAGTDDTSLAHLEGWAKHTTGYCDVTHLPGGHLLSAGDPSGLADVIVNLLQDTAV